MAPSRLGTHILIYGIGTVLSKAVSFLMLPLYTHYLSPADYGTAELLGTTVDVIAMIAGVGIGATIFKYYSRYERQDEKNEVISTALILTLSLAGTTALIGGTFAEPLALLVFGDETKAEYFRIIFVTFFLQQGVLTVGWLYLRALQWSARFVLIGLGRLVLQVGLNVLFLVHFELGLRGMLYSTVLTEMATASVFLSIIVPRVGLRFARDKARELLRFGYPFVFTSLSSFTLMYSDRYFLNAYGTLDAIGLYALAYKFGFLLGTIVFGPFLQVWEPERFEVAKRPDGPQIASRVFFFYTLATGTLALALALFSSDILRVMTGPRYWSAHRYVPIILLAFVFHGWVFFCNFGLYHGGRSGRLATASMIAAAAALLGNALFIPRFGAMGAAWATVGTFGLRFLLVNRWAQEDYPIPYRWRRHVAIGVLAVVAYVASRVLEPAGLVASVLLKSACLLAFLAAVGALVMEREERMTLAGFVRWPLHTLSSLARARA